MRRTLIATAVWQRAAAMCIAALVALTFATCALPAAGQGAEQARHFSLDFVQTDLVDVIKALAAQSGVNIATNGSAKGDVTLRLSNVTLEQALTIVTKLNGLEYAVMDGTYVVGKPDEIAALKAATFVSRAVTVSRLKASDAQQTVAKVAPDVNVSVQPGTSTLLLLGTPVGVGKAESILREMDASAQAAPPTSEVAQLKYLLASQAAQIVSKAVPAVQVSEGTTGTLVLTGDATEIARARTVLSGVDIVPQAGAAEREVYRIRYADPYELQEKLEELLPGLKVILGPRASTPTVTSSTTGASASSTANLSAPQMTTAGATASTGTGTSSGGTGAPRVQLSAVTTLILLGSRATLDRALELLKELDTAPKQVTIAAMITEVEKGSLSQFGIDWAGLGGKTGIIVGEPTPATTGGSGSSGGTTGLADGIARELKLGKFMRSQLQFNGVISALVSHNQARILANPTITLLDGTQAALHAGEKIYYPQQVGTDLTGKPIYSTAQIDVGVTLAVRPQLCDNGDITLTLVPTVSALVDSVFPGYPTILERSTVTTVRVKNGETFVIGGLVRDDEIVTSTRIPLLGDLPIVGRLFRFDKRQPQHTEIVIAITPTIKQEKG